MVDNCGGDQASVLQAPNAEGIVREESLRRDSPVVAVAAVGSMSASFFTFLAILFPVMLASGSIAQCRAAWIAARMFRSYRAHAAFFFS